MLNALIPFSRRILFSPGSTSRSPMYTSLRRLSRFSSPSHPKYSSLSSVARPVRNATGMPCTLPDPDVSGVLISACASTQITATSRFSLSRTARAVPPTVPIAMLWSPPSAALARVAVDLVGDAPRHGRHGLGVLHAPVGRVLAWGGHEVCVEVDCVVAVQAVAEFVAELGEEAGLDQGGGGGVDAWFALLGYRIVSQAGLFALEADGDNAQILRVAQELALDHACVLVLVLVVMAIGTCLGQTGLALLVVVVGAAVASGGAVLEGWSDHDDGNQKIEQED
ncbi:hypothetical protein VP1G_11048 [Cytospora mali]|uniref:Uncharacterized protein n=1 Tax=Cytospora mali TaxID=578113 RepID=A0A194V5C6_CYTMA|nr:hypothetical protein VP1G_11048 [Valsa mali var. pyri (nom. inval.)]